MEPISMSCSAVTSPPGMRGTTEYVPFFWMLARKWLLLSCRAACSPSSTWSLLVEARIEATVGLQISQPVPRPYRATRPEKVRMPVAETISNSSARLWSKCSQRAVDSSTPESTSSVLTVGRHPPHVVPAFVQPLIAARSQAPPAMAPQMEPFVTLLHEQMTASSGSASAPSSAPAGETRAPGSPGTSRPTYALSVVYADASPTRMPPRRVRASSLRTTLA